ncbi:MAG: S-layer homology domain-containing protein [Negativicutes bacterium]|nr:S-layer homology domain-containing protein [Negativicutes bacterium]
MKNRCLLLLLSTFLFCLLFAPPVYAGETDSNVTLVLKAMNILTFEPSGEADPLQPVTRAEFAALLVSASQYKTILSSNSLVSPFWDVKYNHPYAAAVKAAASAGWLVGYLDGSYRPDQAIKPEEAMTAALRLLGYTAEDLSGIYPAAQLRKAQSLGLSDGLSPMSAKNLLLTDARQLIYNLLTAKTKSNVYYATTLGYSVNASGELDYTGLIAANLQGPFILGSNSLDSLIPFDLANAVVYRNGKPANVTAIVANDVIYYHYNLQTIWAYSNQIVGLYTAASPNTVAPTKVTVAGNTYSLGSTTATYKLSAMGEFVVGDTITLLLGMNGEVVDVCSPQESSGIQYGVVTATNVETFLTNTSGSQVVKITTVACTDGTTRQYNSNTAVSVGDLVSVGIVNGSVNLKRLPIKRIGGTIDAAAAKLGDYSLASDIKILDTDSGGHFCTLTAARLANIELSSEDIRYFVQNEAKEITDLILYDVTGDLHTYGFITDVTETTTSVSDGAGGKVDVTHYIFSYQSNNVKGSYSSPIDNLRGGVMLFYQNNIVTTIATLSEFDIDTISNYAATGNQQEYRLADNLQVYIKADGKTYLTNLAAVANPDVYKLRGYYDNFSFAAGNRIRVILAIAK